MCLWVKVKVRTPKLYRQSASSVLVTGDSRKPARHLQSPPSPNLLTNEGRGAGWLTNERRGRSACFQEFFWLTFRLAALAAEPNTLLTRSLILLCVWPSTFLILLSLLSRLPWTSTVNLFKTIINILQPFWSVQFQIKVSLLVNSKCLAASASVAPFLIASVWRKKQTPSCFHPVTRCQEKEDEDAAAVFPDPADGQDWSCPRATLPRSLPLPGLPTDPLVPL